MPGCLRSTPAGTSRCRTAISSKIGRDRATRRLMTSWRSLSPGCAMARRRLRADGVRRSSCCSPQTARHFRPTFFRLGSLIATTGPRSTGISSDSRPGGSTSPWLGRGGSDSFVSGGKACVRRLVCLGVEARDAFRVIVGVESRDGEQVGRSEVYRDRGVALTPFFANYLMPDLVIAELAGRLRLRLA